MPAATPPGPPLTNYGTNGVADAPFDARAAGDVEAVYARIAKRIIPVLILLFVMA